MPPGGFRVALINAVDLNAAFEAQVMSCFLVRLRIADGQGNRELIAGLNRDPQFGMTVMLGVGGILAEAMADVVFRLVPLERWTPWTWSTSSGRRRSSGRSGASRRSTGTLLADVLVGLSGAAEADAPTCRPTSTR